MPDQALRRHGARSRTNENRRLIAAPPAPVSAGMDQAGGLIQSHDRDVGQACSCSRYRLYPAPMPSDVETENDASNRGGWFASGGVVSGLLAFVGASCCVLPVILVNLGVSTALVLQLGFFARHQALFQWGALALLLAATVVAFRSGRPRPRIIILLLIGFGLAIIAFVLPSHEREILQWLGLR